ncbi:MAG: UrcA family protein [Pseudomonadota bacterium]
MRTPRTLLTALACTLAMASAPAFAELKGQGEEVTFKLDLQSPASEIYRSIRKQAWTACAPSYDSPTVTVRSTLRRKCQTQLVRDVVEALAEPDIIRLAKADGIRARS